jgi:hypothetical protein
MGCLAGLHAPKLGGDLLRELTRVVAALPADVQDRDAGAGQDVIDEGVALTPIGALVR